MSRTRVIESRALDHYYGENTGRILARFGDARIPALHSDVKAPHSSKNVSYGTCCMYSITLSARLLIVPHRGSPFDRASPWPL